MRLKNFIKQQTRLISAAEVPDDLDHWTTLVTPLFDADLYLLQNGDVKKAGIDPILHYLKYGWKERRNPATGFSTKHYLEAFPELLQEGIPPLVHAVMIQKMPVDQRVKDFFEEAYYLSKNPFLKDTGISPLHHYLLKGWKNERDPSPYFSTRHYLTQVPALNNGDLCPLVHYIQEGMPPKIELTPDPEISADVDKWSQLFDKNLVSILQGNRGKSCIDALRAHNIHAIAAMFSPKDYREHHPDLASESDLALLARYFLSDFPEGISPGPLFDAGHYRRQLATAQILLPKEGSEFKDWLKRGSIIGISPNSAFDLENYARFNPSLKATLEHWLMHGLSENRQYFPNITFNHISTTQQDKLAKRSPARIFAEDIAGHAWKELEQVRKFRDGAFEEYVSQMRRVEPMIGIVSKNTPSYFAPWHDGLYLLFKECIERLPAETFENVVLIPFCKMGGSDFVSGVLSQALTQTGVKVLVLRTEQSDWERPDWFPKHVDSVDLSDLLCQVDMRLRSQILYALLHHVEARRIFNVNSRAAYETILRFGSQLHQYMEVYTYYFCADRRLDESEAGYAIDFFSQIQKYLDCALIDNADFARVLVERHKLPPSMASRVQPVYSPAMENYEGPAAVVKQIATRAERKRPCILWAGRFDRQKRFDLVQKIALKLPDWDFLCWGKAVLEQGPDMSYLPVNMRLMGTYSSLDELPLQDCDGWLYTSGWDGLPTILIEIAAHGVPVVASAVGGVPELIDETTGWPVHPDATEDDYVAALQKMLRNPRDRKTRAEVLMKRARSQHSFKQYCATLNAILAGDSLQK